MFCYSLFMRRHFLVLMVVLAVMRGFVGDAMAVQMSLGQLGTLGTLVPDGALTSAQDPHPCHSVDSRAAQDVPAEGNAQTPDCTSCQICHAPALQTRWDVAGLFFLQCDSPPLQSASWVSAELDEPHKPPIA
jgi:hypothetical protein